MNRTLHQNSQLHLLLTRLNLMGEKDLLVHQYTHGRTQHSSEMTMEECQALINALNAKQYQIKNPAFSFDKDADKQRKKILSICHEMGWEVSGGKIDWNRLNAYILKYGYLKKPLNNYTYKELPILVTQFENLIKTTVYK